MVHRWSDLSVMVVDRKLCNHCPLLLRSKTINYGPKPTKVFNSWFNETGAEEIVSKAWSIEVTSSRPNICFKLKMKNVNLALKSWSKEQFGNLDAEIEKAKSEACSWEQIADSRIINEVERGKWLEARINKNAILGLHNNGAREENPSLVKKEVLRYFERTFKETCAQRPTLPERVGNFISIEEANDLEIKFDEEEVWVAVHGCAGSKAPGPDGFNFKFFKKFWSIIKCELMRANDWFLV
ncbi:uncharacterized protein [Rutidosis leptorrhynchoides]|uniref:uncharacterized protein n=1 Tax=Rutidosis leptorrhynchoides TaxID=125765 RepID=UPI003A993079